MRTSLLVVSALFVVGCGSSVVATDGGRDAAAEAGMDAGTDAGADAGVDASTDAGVDAAVDAGPDLGPPDMGQPCTGMIMGYCGLAGESCFCCPGAGPTQHCTCSTACSGDTDCTDSARPSCHMSPGASTGFCESTAFMCCWLCG